MMDMDPRLQLDLLIRIAVAIALSAIVGIERELQQEQAGLRTHTLVGLGAAAFTVLSMFGFPLGGDPTRVAAGIVTGIGFIGAGTIISQCGIGPRPQHGGLALGCGRDRHGRGRRSIRLRSRHDGPGAVCA